MSPLTPRVYDPVKPNRHGVRLYPLGYDPDDPDLIDIRRFSPEEVELFNPNGPVNPPTPKPRQRQLGVVSCWAIFALPGLFFIVTGGTGWIATVFFSAITTFVGSLWAGFCPFRNFVVKNGIGLCGFCTLITAGIGLFILPQYLIVIAIAIAAHAAYRVIRE
jgi:hypothetical protein